MKISLPLERMTVAELAVMESLWADLSRDEATVESPMWHGDVLRDRDAAVAEGRESPIDWEEAKRRLRELRG